MLHKTPLAFETISETPFHHLFHPLERASLMIALTEIMSEEMGNRYPSLAAGGS